MQPTPHLRLGNESGKWFDRFKGIGVALLVRGG
jgi:hypothetical protein